MRRALIQGLVGLALALVAVPAAAKAPAFEWTTPTRFGHDRGGDRCCVPEVRCCSEKDSDADLEGPAAIGLGTGIAIAILALIALALRGRERTPPEAQGEDTLPKLFSDGLHDEDVVEGFGALLEASSEWVHRRVESIEFIDESTIRRRVSVDFTPKACSADHRLEYAPIALLHKGVLARFDLRDEAGNSLPLLTANQNAAFAAQYMLSIARKAVSGRLPDRLEELCWRIARAEPPEAEQAIDEIAGQLEPRTARERLRDDPLFRSVTETFARNFAVIVEIDEPSARRVVKFAYDEVVWGGPKLLARLGLRPETLVITMPELGDAGSRHIEFLRADGLETFDPALVARTPAGKALVRRAAARIGREVHLLITDAPQGTAGVAGVRLRARREGILVGGPLLAALAASLLSATWFALPELAGNANEAASVLLAIPAALGAYLGARSPHPLVASMLTGARTLLFVSGVLSLAAAGALALDCSVDALRTILGVAAPLSWLSAGGLATIWILPKAPRRQLRPRRL